MAIIDPEKFEMAALTEKFLSEVLEADDKGMTEIYKAVINIFDGNETLIKRFLLYRAYALS